VACWAGPLDQGEEALRPFHDVAPVVAEFVGPMPYPALNSAFDGLVPPGLQHYWKASFVNELADGAISAHEAHGPDVPAVNSTMHIYPINGAAHRVAPDATAFAYRDANIEWVRLLRRDRAPFGGGRLRQLHGRRRPGSEQGRLQGERRAARRHQADVRPGQPLPSEPEHQAVAEPLSVRSRPLARSASRGGADGGDVVERGWVLEAGEVTEVLPRRDGPDRPPHDLRRARSWQFAHEQHPFGFEGSPEA
jgi:hypothetical protein